VGRRCHRPRAARALKTGLYAYAKSA
jgi:hypothetical protein